MNTLKAKAEEITDSIVMSFRADWEERLRLNTVRAVFRKKGPRSTALRFLYVYAGAPISGLIGRLLVTEYGKVSTAMALKHLNDARLSITEFREYVAEELDICMFKVSEFQPALRPVGCQDLKVKFGFVAPQKFFFLSPSGQVSVDTECGFA
ncbi:MAG: hypothetical protein JNM43_18045 [Planctomycetaceae bacterium]|nr:hypothetical protein [Planctomycetaceae bacterium]